MGRPPLAPGKHGVIGFYRDRGSGRVRARARFRDYDGHYRAVTRWGAGQSDAQARLLAALEEQAAFPVGQWATEAKVCEVVSLWRSDLAASSLAPSTRQLYTAAARLYVQPAVGDLRLGELTPALLDRALAQVRLRHGALRHNPVRDTAPSPARTTRSAP